MHEDFQILGMHCQGCAAKIRRALEDLPAVGAAEVTLEPPRARLDLKAPVALAELDAALRRVGDYSIVKAPTSDQGAGPDAGELERSSASTIAAKNEGNLARASAADTEPGDTASRGRSFLATYRPLLLLALYLILGSAVLAFGAESPAMAFSRFFMAGFFLAFSFFKFLDLRGFASSYAMYDVVARRTHAWGYAYPFVELALGVLYLSGWNPVVTNSITLVVMSVSAIGVIQSMVAKRAIRCACLGTVFDLPVSNVTLIEDLLMAVMAAGMLVWHSASGA